MSPRHQHTHSGFYSAILCVILTLFILPVQAQAGALAAFINSSGQLVVASADGNLRWIVTNPGESLHPNLGYAWSPNGDELFFAVQTGGGVSLRIGDIDTQSAREIAVESGNLSGGEWTDNGILIASGSTLRFYQADGSVTGTDAGAPVQVLSRHADARLSAASGAVIFWQAGSFHLLRRDGSVVNLAGSSDAAGLENALWSQDAPLVAYSAFNEQSNRILVVATTNGEAIGLSSGRSTPLTPVAWLPGTTQLLYYGADYQIYLADVGCVVNGCGANPLESGVVVLPASAVEVRPTRNTLFFRDGEQIRGVRLNCVGANNCLDSAFTVGTQAVADASLSLRGNTLVYTAYSQDVFNRNDRTIWRVDVSCAPDCAAQPLLVGAVNGALSPDGRVLIADILGSGLHVVALADLRQVMLSGSGAALAAARWNG